MTRFIRAVVLISIVGIASCAMFPNPKTNAERLIVAEGQVTAVANSAVSMYRSGVLTDSQRDSILRQLKSANTALDTAWAVIGAGGDTGDTLVIINKILLGIRTELTQIQENRE